MVQAAGVSFRQYTSYIKNAFLISDSIVPEAVIATKCDSTTCCFIRSGTRPLTLRPIQPLTLRPARLLPMYTTYPRPPSHLPAHARPCLGVDLGEPVWQ